MCPVWLDLGVPEPEELSREDLIALVRGQAERIAAQDAQIAELTEVNEQLTGRLARLEHLLSRDSGNSSMPPSRDDDPGKSAQKAKRSGVGVGGRGGSSPGLGGRTWRGGRIPAIGSTGSRPVAVGVVPIWPMRGIWGSSTGTSSMRSRRWW